MSEDWFGWVGLKPMHIGNIDTDNVELASCIQHIINIAGSNRDRRCPKMDCNDL